MSIGRIVGAAGKSASSSRPPEIDKILGAFNTWAYKREQPSDLALLTTMVAKAVQSRQPLPFVLYWGKGPRAQIAEPDEICLDFLASMEHRIKSVYPYGAQLFLLLTDTHAVLNEHLREDSGKYFAEIAAAAGRRGFVSRYLSDVVDTAAKTTELSIKEVATPELIESLCRSASKWYLGSDTTMQAAANYFATNMQEKLAVEKEYPDSVFTTFNGSAMRMLFPNNLPIFYMYSLKKGFGVKPWFMNDHRDSRDKDAPTSREHAVNIFAAESTVGNDGVF